MNSVKLQGTKLIYRTKPKSLELVNEFTEVAGYKVNTQKSVDFYIPIMNFQKNK